jgi:hypothetical protein
MMFINQIVSRRNTMDMEKNGFEKHIFICGIKP